MSVSLFYFSYNLVFKSSKETEVFTFHSLKKNNYKYGSKKVSHNNFAIFPQSPNKIKEERKKEKKRKQVL